MMRCSVQPREQIFVKGYEFFLRVSKKLTAKSFREILKWDDKEILKEDIYTYIHIYIYISRGKTKSYWWSDTNTVL